MTSEETISVPRTEYEALIDRNLELEDTLAALEADDGSRVPHEVALAIIRGESPVLAFRSHLGLTLRELSARPGSPQAICPRSSAGASRAPLPPWPGSRLRSALRSTAC